MKILKSLTFSITVFLFLFLASCSEEEIAQNQLRIPDQFSVDIPSAISSGTGGIDGRIAGDGDGVIEGEEIYAALPHFIRIGEASAEAIEFTLIIGATLEAANIRTFTTKSDDDDRDKRFDINEGVTRGGIDYEFEMRVTDIDGSGAEELALQLLWNTDPVEGVGILRPYYIDRSENDDIDAYARIDYSEDDPTYDAIMTVSIAGIETVENGDIDNLKMFVGKSGDIVEVFGNSNHPDITIIDTDFTGGRNYAFVGRGNESSNIGVVKLALPPSNVDTDDVFGNYSVYSILEAEINTVANLDQSVIDAILAEAGSPAYFDASGFISAGETLPDGFSEDFVDLEGKNPFVPVQVRDLSISFLQ